MGAITSQITSFNRSIRRRSKKTSKLRLTGLCAGNSPGTGEFPAQMASDAENVSIWWRHHDIWYRCKLLRCLWLILPASEKYSTCTSSKMNNMTCLNDTKGWIRNDRIVIRYENKCSPNSFFYGLWATYVVWFPLLPVRVSWFEMHFLDTYVW